MSMGFLQGPLEGIATDMRAPELSMQGLHSPRQSSSTDSVLMCSTIGWGSRLNSCEGAADDDAPVQSTCASEGAAYSPLPACTLLVPAPSFAFAAVDGQRSPCEALAAEHSHDSFTERALSACQMPAFQNPLFSPSSLALLRLPSASQMGMGMPLPRSGGDASPGSMLHHEREQRQLVEEACKEYEETLLTWQELLQQADAEIAALRSAKTRLMRENSTLQQEMMTSWEERLELERTLRGLQLQVQKTSDGSNSMGHSTSGRDSAPGVDQGSSSGGNGVTVVPGMDMDEVVRRLASKSCEVAMLRGEQEVCHHEIRALNAINTQLMAKLEQLSKGSAPAARSFFSAFHLKK